MGIALTPNLEEATFTDGVSAYRKTTDVTRCTFLGLETISTVCPNDSGGEDTKYTSTRIAKFQDFYVPHSKMWFGWGLDTDTVEATMSRVSITTQGVNYCLKGLGVYKSSGSQTEGRLVLKSLNLRSQFNGREHSAR